MSDCQLHSNREDAGEEHFQTSSMVSAENDPRRPGTVWVLNLDWAIPSFTPRLPAVFTRLGPESAPALAEAMGLDDPVTVLRRFVSRRRCYAALVENALAAYGWVSFCEEHIGEIGLNIRLEAGEAYL